MADINFQPIFDYIDQNNHTLKEEIVVAVRAELREIKTTIANMATDIRTLKEEMFVANHRIRRLEGWAQPVGAKIDIPFVF